MGFWGQEGSQESLRRVWMALKSISTVLEEVPKEFIRG